MITTALVLTLAAKVTIVLAFAALLDGAVLRRHASAAARHLLWTAAVVGSLALPLLGGVLPHWRVALPRPTATSPTRQATRVVDGGAVPRATPSERVDASVAAIPTPRADAVPRVRAPEPARRPTAIPWTSLLAALWAAGAVACLARIALERRVVRELARRAAPVRDPRWLALADTAAAALGVRRRVRLLRDAESTMPLTWGTLRPAVLLPADADRWSEPRRRAVLLHELAHVARHDCLAQTLAAAACALYWPHPGVWYAAARLRVERELACDDRALARGVPGRDYAAHLLEIARSFRAPRRLSALAVSMATLSPLESRLRALIDETRPRGVPRRRVTVPVASLGAMLLLPLAAVRPGAAPGSVVPVTRAAAPAPSVAGRAIPGGRWSMRLATPAEQAEEETSGPAVHVMLLTPGINTFVVGLDRFEGLTEERIRSGGDSSLRFTLRRDAGRLELEGRFRGGRGEGRFDFVPDSTFGDALARRGMRRPTAREQLSLALHGVELRFVDTLLAQGYATPTTEELVSAGMSGATPRYQREMAALGYRFRTLRSLQNASDLGVTPATIRALDSLGYARLPLVDLIRMENESVSPEFVRRANAAAGRRLAVDELMRLRLSGASAAAPSATPAAVAPAPLAAPTAPAPSTPDAVTTPVSLITSDTPLGGSWVLSTRPDGRLWLELLWSDDTQWRRLVEVAELRGIGAAEIAAPSSGPVAFSVGGDAGRFEMRGTFRGGRGTGELRFVPDRDFPATLRALGLAGAEATSDHMLKNLAYGGTTADDIRAFARLGLTPLSVRSLVDLAVFQVTPAYMRAVVDAGVTDAHDPHALTDLRLGGVPASYPGALAALGVGPLSSGALTDLWHAAVTPAFVRAAREAGQRDLSPAALIELRGRRRR